jgi:hypothetical protein
MPATVVLRASCVVVDVFPLPSILTWQALSTAYNCPKDMATNLKLISYQSRRVNSLQSSSRTESITEKSMDLLTAIVKYYSACLQVFRRGFVGKK